MASVESAHGSNATHGDPDIVVVGSGPNGLVAACLLARAGLDVLVIEADEHIGGGARSEASTLPGFRHDSCSAFFPLAAVGPISRLPLEQHGLQWCNSPRPYGGAALGGHGVTLGRDVNESADLFDRVWRGDGRAWRELYGWWQAGGPAFLSLLFHPLGHPAPLAAAVRHLRSPQRVLQFAQLAGGSAAALTERLFASQDARVWLTGSVLHSDLAPDDAGGGGFGMMLCGLAQQVGMPVPRGGAQAIPDALAGLLRAIGGRILTGQRVERIVIRAGRAVAVTTASYEIRARRAVVATVEPQALFLNLVGDRHLPTDFLRLVRRYRWGTGVFQMNLALSGLPTFAAEALNGTLVSHLARDVGELTRSVAAARHGTLPRHPLLVVGLHTLVDPSRAPTGQHTLWAMTHVPTRIHDDDAARISSRDWAEARAPFLERMLDELEAYAPGTRHLVRAAHARTPVDLEAHNSNLVGGDIGSGSYTLDQQLVFRPVPGWFRYKSPIKGLYMSGAATHPGGGVHGAAGANAASVVLADLRLAGALQPIGRSLGAVRTWLVPARRLSASSASPLRVAADGVGPLLQHEYWAEIDAPGVAPSALVDIVRDRFPVLASHRFATFSRASAANGPAGQGDRLQVALPGAGRHDLVIIAVEPTSLTFETAGAHPEAGRVSIAAERLSSGRLLVRIRSRTRANGWLNLLAYRVAGEALQEHVWATLIERLADAADGVLVGRVAMRTTDESDAETPADVAPRRASTFETRLDRT